MLHKVLLPPVVLNSFRSGTAVIRYLQTSGRHALRASIVKKHFPNSAVLQIEARRATGSSANCPSSRDLRTLQKVPPLRLPPLPSIPSPPDPSPPNPPPAPPSSLPHPVPAPRGSARPRPTQGAPAGRAGSGRGDCQLGLAESARPAHFGAPRRRAPAPPYLPPPPLARRPRTMFSCPRRWGAGSGYERVPAGPEAQVMLVGPGGRGGRSWPLAVGRRRPPVRTRPGHGWLRAAFSQQSPPTETDGRAQSWELTPVPRTL